MINEIGSFIQQSTPPRERATPSEGSGLPWQYRTAIEWWCDVAPRDAEARLLRQFIERSGGPALEVGFGSGQRLLACRTAGLDIDGIETHRGLYDACRERFDELGQSRHRLYLQPLHEIELPRRYRSIYAGRVLGTSAHREADALGLHRLYRALEPGGSLLIDHPAPWGNPSRWSTWWGGASRAWPPALADHTLASPSGTEILELTSRIVEHAPDATSLSYTVRARLYRRGDLSGSRGLALRQSFYSRREVEALLCRAGFEARCIAAVYLPEARRHVWLAEKGCTPRRGGTGGAVLGPIGQAGALAVRGLVMALEGIFETEDRTPVTCRQNLRWPSHPSMRSMLSLS